MGYLKIIIFPYHKSLELEVEDSLCNKIIRALKNFKSNLGYGNLNIPDTGFRGIELTYENSKKVFFYNSDVIYKNLNISALLFDKNKILFELLAARALKSNYNELRYFFRALQERRKML